MTPSGGSGGSAAGGAPPAPNPTPPKPSDPGFAVAKPSPLAPGPDAVADFRIPPFLLPIYQAAGARYGVPWQVLAAINEIETDYGRNDALSSAGAVGWMQFLPDTFRRWGVDANGDGRADPDNPIDAIYSAANYLRGAGANRDLSAAIFAYNHADWYVQSVLLRARVIGGLPPGVVGSLTGLAVGRFPLAAATRYADPLLDRHASAPGLRRGISLFAPAGASVIAVQDGRIAALGRSRRLGPYVVLEDADGNRYTYAGLGRVSAGYPALRRRVHLKPLAPVPLQKESEGLVMPQTAPPPLPPPTTTTPAATTPATNSASSIGGASPSGASPSGASPSGASPSGASPRAASPNGAARKAAPRKHRAPSPRARFVPPVAQQRRAARFAPGTDTRFAGARQAAPAGARLPPPRIKLPAGPAAPRRYAPVGGASVVPEGDRRAVRAAPQATTTTAPTPTPAATLDGSALALLGLTRRDVVARRLKVGAHVIAGTILGQVGAAPASASPHVAFAVRPAGRGAPRVDPKPILDGWRLLDATATDRAAGRDPLLAIAPAGGVLLDAGRAALGRRVLADPRIQIYACGRDDIAKGLIDARVLATLEFLAGSGLDPTVSSLRCGHSRLTASGNVSEHWTGDAVDVAAVNGTPILGHQGAGSITDLTIRRLLTLTGDMQPHQIISLMTFPGADNTLALPDHYNHIHIGFTPRGVPSTTPTGEDVLTPTTWMHLIDQLARLPNPAVRRRPSRYAVPVPSD